MYSIHECVIPFSSAITLPNTAFIQTVWQLLHITKHFKTVVYNDLVECYCRCWLCVFCVV